MTKQVSMLPTGCSEQQVIKRYGNFDKAIAKLAPKNVQLAVIESGINSNRSAFKSDSLKLSQFAKTYTKDNAYLMVELWLLDLSNYAGAGNKLNDDQIQQLAKYFYQDAYSLNFAELGLLFNRIKKGKYGEFYGSVDPIKIMNYLTQFLKQRTEAIESLNNDETSQLRNRTFEESINTNLTEEQRKEIETIKNNFLKKIKW